MRRDVFRLVMLEWNPVAFQQFEQRRLRRIPQHRIRRRAHQPHPARIQVAHPDRFMTKRLALSAADRPGESLESRVANGEMPFATAADRNLFLDIKSTSGSTHVTVISLWNSVLLGYFLSNCNNFRYSARVGLKFSSFTASRKRPALCGLNPAHAGRRSSFSSSFVSSTVPGSRPRHPWSSIFVLIFSFSISWPKKKTAPRNSRSRANPSSRFEISSRTLALGGAIFGSILKRN